MFDAYHNYQVAFWTGGILCAAALVFEMLAKRPAIPQAQEVRAKA
jgi:putative copper export protein